MPSTLCFLSCHNFQPEISAAIAAEGWEDVVALGFPVRCGRPPISWEELRPLLPENCSQLVLLGRACLNNLDQPPSDFPPVRLERQAQCFHLVASAQLVDEAITSGSYLITSSWLADWRGQIRKLGFEPEEASEFFHDFAHELLLLDTLPDAAGKAQFAEMQAVLKMPARRLAVGLDHTRLLLNRLVLNWRLEQAQRIAQQQKSHYASELADHVAAMDLLSQLAQTQTEADAIQAIETLFEMLFAPAAIHYLRLEKDSVVPRGKVPETIQDALQKMSGEHAWTPDGQGFLVRISHGDEKLGLIAVDRLTFPAYRERYLNMALSMTGVCGLAIENARNRRRLLDAEKMASLGMLVAGVAHEVNTPLGISLAAASLLQEQSRHLAEHFAARSMTQSELTHYLETTTASTALLRQNLERIGHLVDAFREVAVKGKGLRTHPFRPRSCLEEIVRSLGDRLPAQQVSLEIDCDPALEIEGTPSDWASIFINLIGNSLKHGFKGRESGNISIRIVATSNGQLKIDYEDDGIGLSPEIVARIFDPFFTTDLQQGMGLGMHLVYNLITHRMGGLILCDSEPGKGAHFHIEIPLIPPGEVIEKVSS